MDKFWQVVKYEYTRHVFRKRFIFALLSLPLMLVFLLGITLLSGLLISDRSPVGYVDNSGILSDAVMTGNPKDPFEPGLSMIAYPSEAEAESALSSGKVQAFFVVPENYPANLNIPLHFSADPDDNMLMQVRDFIKTNLLRSRSIADLERIQAGTTFIQVSQDGSRQFAENEWYNLAIPILVAILFIVVIMTSGGYLLQAVVEEKENRTMEIIVTSVSPMQLMAGKIIGNISVGLTQLFIWLFFSGLAILVASRSIPFLSNIKLPLDYLVKNLLFILPAYVSVAAMMAALGATVTGSQEAQQVSGIFTLPIMMPLWFVAPILSNPNGPIAVFLSYFPLSAPITLALRMVFTTVTDLQWSTFFIIQVLFAVFMLWLAARAFRIGMLQYGKRIRLMDILRKEVRHV